MAFRRAIPLIVAGFLVLSGHAFASSSTSSSSSSSNSSVQDAVCDSDVYTRMKEKARMEAERETYVNQSMILKPDSLFAITCFSQQMGQTKKNLGILEQGESSGSTTRFDNLIDGPTGISTAFIGKTDSNGKVILTPDTNSTSNVTTTDDKYEASPNKNATFKCGEMEKLWKQSQCGNFRAGDLPSLKETGSSYEARKYPEACDGNKDDKTDTNYTFAKGFQNIGSPGASLPKYTNADTKSCSTDSYDKLVANNCPQPPGQDDLCAPGTPATGEVTVGGTKFPEGLNCPNQGCIAQNVGGVLKCKKK